MLHLGSKPVFRHNWSLGSVPKTSPENHLQPLQYFILLNLNIRPPQPLPKQHKDRKHLHGALKNPDRLNLLDSNKSLLLLEKILIHFPFLTIRHKNLLNSVRQMTLALRLKRPFTNSPKSYLARRLSRFATTKTYLSVKYYSLQHLQIVKSYLPIFLG